uniref:Uncharacterized protein n=1 Tax=Anopheles maculatus TaxID=74869 RepID=A0A182T409_9DIPT
MNRKAELERKKAKLQALREEKDRRRKEKEQKDLEEAAGKLGHSETSTRKDLDEMLSSLGVAPVSEVLSSLSSVNSATSDQSTTHTPDASLQPSINGIRYPRSSSAEYADYQILISPFFSPFCNR